DDNIRAITTYMKYFKDSKFAVLETPRPKYSHGDVEVSTSLDLYVQEGDEKKLIKLDLNAAKPHAGDIEIILKVTHEASVLAGLGVTARSVIYLDVLRQEQYTGAKLNPRLKKDIDAACETIADIWPRVKQG